MIPFSFQHSDSNIWGSSKLIAFPSISIKNVLPAICPNNQELDYKALDISNGSMAMSAYKELRNSSKNIDVEATRRNLFKYCRLDTYAMYAIYKKILQI